MWSISYLVCNAAKTRKRGKQSPKHEQVKQGTVFAFLVCFLCFAIHTHILCYPSPLRLSSISRYSIVSSIVVSMLFEGNNFSCLLVQMAHLPHINFLNKRNKKNVCVNREHPRVLVYFLTTQCLPRLFFIVVHSFKQTCHKQHSTVVSSTQEKQIKWGGYYRNSKTIWEQASLAFCSCHGIVEKNIDGRQQPWS